MNNLKISVVTVSYNAAATIEETIQSVLGQTYPNVEYIVIDGGSTDGTVDIIKRYIDHLAYWVSEPDKGIYDAMNKGIAAATGDYINFMNAGDRFYDLNTIERLINSADFNSYDIHYGDWNILKKKNSVIRTPGSLSRIKDGAFDGLLCHQATYTRTSLLKKRPYQIKYKISADYEYICYSYTHGLSFKYHPITMCNYSAYGISDRNRLCALKEVRSIGCKYMNHRRIYIRYSQAYFSLVLKSFIKKWLNIFED